MKIRFCAAMLLAALSITIFAGRAAPAEPSEAIQNSPVSGEVIIDTFVPAAPAPSVPAPTQQTLISKEEATAIALADAGFTADQVTRLRTEFGYDDRRPEYEVDFHQGGFEYDYEINAETGEIISRDKDRED